MSYAILINYQILTVALSLNQQIHHSFMSLTETKIIHR